MSASITSEQLRYLRQAGSTISVLYVEDDLQIRTEMVNYLSKIFSDIESCSDGEEGLAAYKNGQFDIVISDILMPKLNGIDMLSEIKKINHSQEMIITSAYTESNYFIDAIALGIDAYILKPITHPQIIEVLYKTVSKIIQNRENDEYRIHLESLVDLKVKEYQRLEEEKIANYEKTLLGLIKMVERRDSYTAGHSQRVAEYSMGIARSLGCSDLECDLIYRAGILHDIGKIATPDTVLLKPGKLDDLERELIKEHVNVGLEMLREIPMFESILPIIASHHERFDGQGYPKKLSGDEIPLLGKVMIIADAFDAMTTNRIYKGRKTIPEAMEEIRLLSGTQFDPQIVPHAIAVLEKIELPEETTQLPQSLLEEERFAYFYKDPVTGLYNGRYLDLVLLKNSYAHLYSCLHVVSLHHFSEYNDRNGWEEGNAILQKIAQMLREYFFESTLFRLHANDFIVLRNTHQPFPEGIYGNSEMLTQSGITCSHFHLDVDKNEPFTLEDLEQRMRVERHTRVHAELA